MSEIADAPPGAAFDVAVIGAGQAGLGTGYFLKRAGLSFVMLDAESGPGAAWRHGWPTLRLFSPAMWSSLPGWPMPRAAGSDHPSRDEVIGYFSEYERRYVLPVRRPVRVVDVEASDEALTVRVATGAPLTARAVVSATGTWGHPFVPDYPGREAFRGRQLHSAQYSGPDAFANTRVLVVGGGNSGAQILAEVSRVAATTWVTATPPSFLPDDVDGRVLFEQATARWHAAQSGQADPTPGGSLGDVVMVPSVVAARARGVLVAREPFEAVTESGVRWRDGTEQSFDAIVWCTGFRPSLAHLASLAVVDTDGRVQVQGTRSVRCPRLWLVGYGEWTGFASATIVGVMRSARATVDEIVRFAAEPITTA